MNEQRLEYYYNEALTVLGGLISTPSFSREENSTAALIEHFLKSHNVESRRAGNNVWAQNRYAVEGKPWLLLNSHHDTVKPVLGYTRDPFKAIVEDGRLYGLGSNDAGGALVSLLVCFLHFYERKDLHYNIIFAATAEEEISGTGGISSILPQLPPIEVAIVGEPTGMAMAIAERGLMVIDAKATGRSGHAARNEGDNALYKAVADIQRIQNLKFPKNSDLLGPVQLNVTVIQTDNLAHNVVPDVCNYVIDVRMNELYKPEEILEILRKELQSELYPRSTRLRSSLIAPEHPLVKAGTLIGRKYFGSPTTSDKALMPFPALKMGPGDSERSHTADEFIFTEQIREGIRIYTELLDAFLA